MSRRAKPKLKPGIVTELPITDVHPDPDQPRTAFHAKRLQELADNIKARGIQQPITVRLVAGRALIKTGERRWRAAKLAGLTKVPVLLDGEHRVGAPVDVLIDQLAENDLREDLNAIEHAEALAKFQAAGMGPTEISDKLAQHGIHMARSTVSNLLRLNGLPDNAKELVRKGALKESYARDLLPFVDPEITPKIVNTVVKELEKLDEISQRVFRNALNDSLHRHATRLNYNDKQCTKKSCKCFVEVDSSWGKERYCLNKKALAEKRAVAEEQRKQKAEKQAKKQVSDAPVETDPTKVKPVKVKLNDEGIVATSRLDWRKYNELGQDYPDFDQTPCQGCPHNHPASHDGKVPADPTCFYPPCFQKLKSDATKIRNRDEKIRVMLDEEALPELLKVAASEPVAGELLTPLLAFQVASNSYNHRLTALRTKLKKPRLNDFLTSTLATEDVSTIVGELIKSLPKEWRHELALHLSLQPGDWWKTTEEFAKLFVKAELKEMAPNYDPPDVPVGQWRERLLLEVKTPAIVHRVWQQSWVQEHHLPDEGADVDCCRECGCTEFYPCPGGCHWVELPDLDGLGLCSACADIDSGEPEAMVG